MFFRSLFAFGGAACATAQTTPLSLDAAIRVAWSHDPVVAVFALAPEAARAREEQAGLRPNPEVEVRGAVPAGGDSEWSVGVGVSQRLPRLERVEQARALARLGGAAAEWQGREQRRLVAGEVRRAFYEAVLQRARRESARRSLDAQRAWRAALEPRRAAGELAAAELDLPEFELQRAEQALAIADADEAASLQRLRGRLRLAADAPLEIDAGLEQLLARPVPVAPAAIEGVRPALGLAAHRVRVAEAALALARSESRGDWTVGGGVDFERRANDFTGRLENEPRLSVSATVPWPRGVANRGDIREKQAALRIAEAELTALRAEVAGEIATAIATVSALRPAVAGQRSPSTSAAKALPEALRAAHERGEVPDLQVMQARQLRLTLEADWLQAAARYATALADAETAVGLVPPQP